MFKGRKGDKNDPRLYAAACEKLGERELVHSNKWFNVYNRGGYYTTENHARQLVVLPVVRGGGIVMVRVKRPVLDDAPLELPAGGILEGEAPAVGAARELAEETGITVGDVGRFEEVIPVAPAPNRNPHLAHVFQVTVEPEEFAGRGAHDNEIESVHLLTFDEARRMIRSGEIYLMAPIALILRYLDSQTG